MDKDAHSEARTRRINLLIYRLLLELEQGLAAARAAKSDTLSLLAQNLTANEGANP
jgi:hypothetical protein